MIMKMFYNLSACGLDKSYPYDKKIYMTIKISYIFLSRNFQFRFPREKFNR